MYSPEICQRTIKFAARIIKLSQSLPKNAAGFAVANQIVRSGTFKPSLLSKIYAENQELIKILITILRKSKAKL